MSKWKNFIHHFMGGNDAECRQSVLRIFIVAIATGYIIYSQGFQYENFNDSKMILQLLAVASLGFSVFTHSRIRRSPGIFSFRILAGILHDIGLVTAFCYLGEELSTVFIFVYPFCAIGNGFRFGEKWLLVSTLCGIIGLAILLSTSTYWSELPMVGTGFAINFIMVVSYTGLLLRKLRNSTAQLEKLATHDFLTGLPNRRYLMEKLRNTLEFNGRNRSNVACVYFDLDGFKLVNDTLGHGAGDLLLKEVALRTKALICETDVIARLGGDEFTILVNGLQSAVEAEILCRKLVCAVADITEIMGQSIKISVSVGCVIVPPTTLYGSDDISEDAIVRQADACMYLSKKSGRGRYTIADHRTTTLRAVA